MTYRLLWILAGVILGVCAVIVAALVDARDPYRHADVPLTIDDDTHDGPDPTDRGFMAPAP